ncbi:protein transport protein SEC16B homolog isoform X2 [Cornus florida]|uniref:protein transport protein SEC16B homolog isoform X2 n=1 Tax=Cornus florida TaxID=4283 RepID=UPI002899EB49|nr:protein transport protein SEC16B homolog isoform X2 [Cornus florida]
MASNPPFQVEDTDEDFFDKLVDDDDEYKVTPSSSSVPNFADGNESDEAKAFANLSVGETGFEDSGGEGGIEAEGGAITGHGEGGIEAKGGAITGDVNKVSVDAHVEHNSSLVSSNSFAFDGIVESLNDVKESEVTPDSAISKSNGSVGSGVKEVQWSAFSSDSAQDGFNGFGSYSDFFSEFGDGAVDPHGKVVDNLNSETKTVPGNEELKTAYTDNAYNYAQYQENQVYGAATEQSGAATEQSTEVQDLNSSQYWENLYPGWKYDANTGQWYQVEGYDATANAQGSFDTSLVGDHAVSDGKLDVSYMQQTAHSVAGAVTESGSTESVTNWNQVSQESGITGSVSNWNQMSQGNNGYPEHMVFDPQYPGWYYDTIAQEWRSLETYTPSVQSAVQSTVQAHDQLNQNGFASTGNLSGGNDHKTYGEYGQVSNYRSEGFGSQGQDYNWNGSFSNYNQQGLNVWQPETVAKSGSNVWQPETVAQNEFSSDYGGNQQLDNHYGSTFSVANHVNQLKSNDSRGTVPSYEKASQVHNDFSTISGSQSFVPGGNFNQQFNQPRMEPKEQMHASSDYYGNQNSVNFSQPFQSSHQYSYAPSAGRSSAGRPPHALVTFGFGGKLIVLKDNSSLNTSSYGSQDPVGGSISVLNLMEVVTGKTDASSTRLGAHTYFHTLCRQSFPGPMVGGNVGNKELNKWIDERITNCGSTEMDYRKSEVLRLLLSLLKIAHQHYGKLRSPFGTDTASKESDAPESAVARLFASAKINSAQYGALAHCLQKLPSEGQMQATAAEVQSLLVAGRKKDALLCAQNGQLWGPALVLAAQLGDQYYVDTVKQMALYQLVSGSPLRTLCLLIAGQPADVFSTDITTDTGVPGALNMPQQPAQFGTNGMLDNWEENLALITANRTKDDELVLIHLGDCLWKERSEIIAAHICYLVAEANFEPYSDSARLCLIGADHWKFPRTFASPEAIQRTELYEYSKVLGNSQFILLPFQPYKLIYAHMLAEVGKVSESLKYCQAVLKSLKTGRAPEVETWRQLVSSLEERIRTHQQAGYSTNLAPAKLVGKLLNLFDSTAHRVVGGLPPPVPSTSHGSAQGNDHYHQTMGPRVSTSQSTMAMSSLMPSSSMEPISEWTADGNRKAKHNRSVSEPDFGRTPRQVDLSKEATSSDAQGKAISGGTSRLGRFSFGSQLFQKTVGLVLKPRQDKQAKLGEKNKFHYDEKLKRWVEEGAELPAEETALPPPPTTSFQNGTSDYNLKSALKIEGSSGNGSPEFKSPVPLEHSSGIPPIPPTSNQFSSRGRMGLQSRYVDTFNQGGGNSTKLFQSPPVPSVKPAGSANPKFFVPTPVSSSEQAFETISDSSVQQVAAVNENPSTSVMNDSFQSPSPSSSMTMQRFPSMDNISKKGVMTNGNGPFPSHSRRTASWSGSMNDAFSPPQRTELKPLGEVLRMPPSSLMPGGTSHLPMNGGSFGDDLHEVEL